MPKVGRISIDLTAGTAQFIADMDKANAKLRDFAASAANTGRGLRGIGDAGAHSVTGVQATSAALRLLEGNITNNLRAGERFLANTLGLGQALQTAFPIVGGLALLGVVTELVKRAGELYDKFQALKDAPGKITEDFRRVSTSIALSNDQLRLENDRLEESIAKLEGKPHNALAEALDEARVAADRLSESLQKDFTDLNKLLKEDQVSLFDRLLGGRAGSSDITDEVKKLGREIEQTQFEGREKVRAIQPGPNAAAQAETINTATEARVQAIRTSGINALKKQLADAQKAQAEFLKPISPTTQVFGAIADVAAGGTGTTALQGKTTANQDQRISILEETIRTLEEQNDRGPLQDKNAADKGKEASLRAAADAAALTRPYQDKLNELAAQLQGFQTKLASIGKGEVGITLANSWAEAQKAIAKLNDDLAKNNQALTIDQVTAIHAAYDRDALAKAELDWKTKLDATTTSIQERIQSLKLLTAAIGEGYEAQKKANVETQLIEKFGKQYNDEQFLSQKDSITGETRRHQVDQVRNRISTEFDENHQKSVAETIDKTRQQIELEESLAIAEASGAEAVREATLQHRLASIEKDNDAASARKLVEAEKALADSQEKVKAATTLANLQQEIDATNRLTAAQVGGAEAVRQAQLQNKIAEIQRNVPQQFQSEEIRKVTEQSESQRNLQVISESLQTGLSYQNRLSELSQEIAYLKSIKGTKDETLATDISLKELEKQQVQVLAEQASVLGSARDGLRTFFQEMAQQGTSAAEEVHDALKKTFDSLNDELAKAISGQKTNWASFFQGISADIAKVSLRNLEATIAGKFAGPVGQVGTHTPGAAPGSSPGPHGIIQTLAASFLGHPANTTAGIGKRDGNTPATALFVTTVDAAQASNPAPSVSAAPASGQAHGYIAPNRTPQTELDRVEASPEFQEWSRQHPIVNFGARATSSPAGSAGSRLLSLPEAIAKEEGFGASPNNLPTRNNNPGDIKFGPFAQSLGATKDQNSAFAKFPTVEAGQSAIPKLLQSENYRNLTLREAVERWNGNNQPNNAQYIDAIVKMTGKSPDTPISELIPATTEQKPGLFGIHLAPGTSLSNSFTNAYSDTSNINASELSQLEFGGFRADGGDVNADELHVVGEEGPELFIPDSDGTIVPNHKLKDFFNNADGSESDSGITNIFGAESIENEALPTQPLPDIQMGDIQGTTTIAPGVVQPKSMRPSLDQLADENSRANAKAAERGLKPNAFDRTRQAMKIATISLATQSAGNQWMGLINASQFAASTAPSMASGSGGGSGTIGSPAPNPDPNLAGSSSASAVDSNAGYTLSPEPSGSGLIMRTPTLATLSPEDQSNLGDFQNSELSQLDNSEQGTWPTVNNSPGAGGSSDSGGGNGLSIGLAIGGMALGLLGRIFSQPGDHHFRPGNRYYIPNFNGAFASGGDVDAGKTHLVGEKGPELFVPKQHGTIIPNHKLSSFHSDSRLSESVTGGGTDIAASRFSEMHSASNSERSFQSLSQSSALPFGGYREMGGAVDPSSSYVVGEGGPELFSTPNYGGSISSSDHSSGDTRSQTVYVDARGTDPAAVEQHIRRGMQATHNASVRTSFKTYQEYKQRTPQSK